MASRLSDTQVAEVAAALTYGDGSAARSPSSVVDALEQSSQTAFAAEDLASMRRAISSLEAKSSWRSEASAGRGQFFVFEGLDRSGKSTQSKLLAKHLEESGAKVKWMCFPDRATPVGTLIDLYLQRKVELSDECVHQLFSANRWEASQSIVAEMNAGTTIVCDRYAFSGVAYSTAKGLDFYWCRAPDCGLPRPDGVFFMQVDAKTGASRANFGDERYENAQMQTRVREEFKNPELRREVNWHDIDGTRSIEEIRAEITAAVAAIQKETQDGLQPTAPLWTGPAFPEPAALSAGGA
jgi:dTMP kinase